MPAADNRCSETRNPALAESFVGEAISPLGTSFNTSQMTIGEPGLPRMFSWRKKQFAVREILEKWKGTGDCTHGSGERYVRKHWYRIRTDENFEMKIYFERQSRSRSKARWRLYSVREPV